MKSIGIIPIRIGSKGVPKKALKLFCGKPLLYWMVNSMLQSELDRVFVMVDSDDVRKCLEEFFLSFMRQDKLIIHNRHAQNATDTATTESAMLECIETYESFFEPDTIVCLGQITSPYISKDIINKALEMREKDDCDVITGVDLNRFTWHSRFAWHNLFQENSYHAENYRLDNRPMRQDKADGVNYQKSYIENGGIYVSKVDQILENETRVTEPVKVLPMSLHTILELDDLDTWESTEKAILVLETNPYEFGMLQTIFGEKM